MVNNLKILLVLLALLGLGTNQHCFAQVADTFLHDTQANPYSLTERSLRKQFEEGEMSAALGESLRPQLVDALSKGYFITDDTIKNILLLWTSYHHDAKSCLGFLDDLSKVIYGRPEIELHILYNRLVYLNPVADKEKYEKTNNELWEIAQQTRVQIDRYDIKSAFDAAQNALNSGDKDKADVLFSRVFYYPWYKIHEFDSSSYFFELYKQSGLKLIYVRIGDLKALQRLEFLPSVAEELNPIKQEAIEETKRMNAKKKEDAKK